MEFWGFLLACAVKEARKMHYDAQYLAAGFIKLNNSDKHLARIQKFSTTQILSDF